MKYNFANQKRTGILNFILFFFLLTIGLYFYLKSSNEEKRILNEGTEITAEVVNSYKSTNIRGDYIWKSDAKYKVDNVMYNYRIEAGVPIGTKFKLKYLPGNPKRAILVNPDEFKEYLKTYR